MLLAVHRLQYQTVAMKCKRNSNTNSNSNPMKCKRNRTSLSLALSAPRRRAPSHCSQHLPSSAHQRRTRRVRPRRLTAGRLRARVFLAGSRERQFDPPTVQEAGGGSDGALVGSARSTRAGMMLRDVPMLAPLTPAQLDSLSASLEVRTFLPGETILRAGSRNGALHMIRSGRVTCLVPKPLYRARHAEIKARTPQRLLPTRAAAPATASANQNTQHSRGPASARVQ